jgi:hypothetical protein
MLLDDLRPASSGLGIGVVFSIAAMRVVHSFLFGVKPLDVSVSGIVVLTLLAVAVFAFAPFMESFPAGPHRGAPNRVTLEGILYR